MKANSFSKNTLRALFLCALSFLLMAMPGKAAEGEAYRGAEAIMAFADALFHSGTLYRATMEYKRFLYFYPTHPDIPKARFNIATAAKIAGDYPSALECYTSLAKEYHDTSTAIKASFEQAEVLYLMRNYPSAHHHYAAFLAHYPDHPLAEQATRALMKIEQLGPVPPDGN
jgi:TolA-binding protein